MDVFFFGNTMSKWFRTKGGDSDDDDEESEEKSSSTKSDSEESDSEESGSSSSDSDEKSDDESGDEVTEAAPKASRFLKNKQEKESDDEDNKGGGKGLSKDMKKNLELEKLASSIKEQMKGNDLKSLNDAVELLIKKFGSTAEIHDVFLKSIFNLDRWVKDKEAKEKAAGDSKSKDKENVKLLALVKQRVRKMMTRDDLKARLQALEKKFAKADNDNDDDDDESVHEKDDKTALRPPTQKEKAKAEEEEKEWKPELIDRKLQEVLLTRGKRGGDKMEPIEAIKRIYQHTSKALIDKRLQMLFHLFAAWCDNSTTHATHIPAASWRSAYDTVLSILSLLGERSDIVLKEAEDDLGETPKYERMQGVQVIPVDGNIMGFVERLDDELTRSLQFTDPHTQAYVERLADEPYIMDALERVHYFYKSRDLHKHAARMAARLLDRLYYRRQADHVKMLAKQRAQTDQRRKKLKKQDEEEERRTLADAEASAQAEAEGAAEPEAELEEGVDGKRRPKVHQQPWWLITGNLPDSLRKCMTTVVKHGDEKAKARAVLCKVYHLALHDKYTQARDIVLMSHIHEIVPSAAPPFQILFNRSLAQLGMAAFRLGLFKDVHTCLNELCATQRVKELLAQGTQNPKFQQDRKPEDERQNKMKLCPFHMHINLDVLEAMSLVAAVLLEVPMMAASPYDSKRKVQSKAFNKLLNHYESQVFLGPPENTRDHIYAATRALLIGDWQACYGFIADLSVWALVPQGDAIKAMLQTRIKEDGLRAYLFQYGQCYETVSLKALAEKYQLSEEVVHATVSKMVFTEELSSSWDQPAGCLRMHHTNPSKLQYLCLMLSDRATALVENNEKLLDARGGGFGLAYKGQDMKPTRPAESLWGNFNRWSTPGGLGLMRRQQTGGQQQRGGMGTSGGFTQMGRPGQQNRSQQGNNRGFQFGNSYGGGGGFGGNSAFNRNRPY